MKEFFDLYMNNADFFVFITIVVISLFIAMIPIILLIKENTNEESII